jgi:transaldolase
LTDSGLKKFLEDYKPLIALNGQVLAASIRNTKHIIECVEVGADVATCPLSAIKGLLNHPLTDSGLKKFLEDYKKVNG